MVKKLSTKYKVVIVNVMVIGLLLCGQYWIDQQNQVDLKSVQSINHSYEVEKSFDLKDLAKMVQAVKDGKSEQTIFEFEDVDGDIMCFELDPDSGKFNTYSNGFKRQNKSDIKFNPKHYNEHNGRYNVKLYGEKPSQDVFYIRPVEDDKAKFDEWFKSFEAINNAEKEIRELQFNTFFPGKYRVINNATSTEFMDRTKGPKKVEYKKGDEVEVKKIMLSEEDDRVRVQLTTDNWISAIAFNEHVWLERIKDDQTEEEEMKVIELQNQINKLRQEKKKIFENIGESTKFTFNSVDNVEVKFEYIQTFKSNYGERKEVFMTATKGNHEYEILDPIITKGEFLNKKYSFEIKSKIQDPSHYFPNFTKPEKKVFNHEYFNAYKKTQQTLQQKIELKKIYQTVIWIVIVILVLILIICVIFYDEEEKAFVFVLVKNENEFEDIQKQYTPDGASNL